MFDVGSAGLSVYLSIQVLCTQLIQSSSQVSIVIYPLVLQALLSKIIGISGDESKVTVGWKVKLISKGK